MPLLCAFTFLVTLQCFDFKKIILTGNAHVVIFLSDSSSDSRTSDYILDTCTSIYDWNFKVKILIIHLSPASLYLFPIQKRKIYFIFLIAEGKRLQNEGLTLDSPFYSLHIMCKTFLLSLLKNHTQYLTTSRHLTTTTLAQAVSFCHLGLSC